MKNVQMKIRNCDTAVYRLHWLYGSKHQVGLVWPVKHFKTPYGAKKHALQALSKFVLDSSGDNFNIQKRDTEYGTVFVNVLTGRVFYGFRIVAAPGPFVSDNVNTYDFDCDGNLVGCVENLEVM